MTYKLNDNMGFGKFRMFSIKKVIQFHPEYIEWCLRTIPDFAMDDDAWNFAISVHPPFQRLWPKADMHTDNPDYCEIETMGCFKFKSKEEAKKALRKMISMAEDAVVLSQLCLC